MANKKALIICESIHHKNTLKLAESMAKQLNADIKRSSEVKIADIDKSELIGFGSGIYDDKYHKLLFDLVDRLPNQNNKKAFVFSTSGVPIKIFGEKFFYRYTKKCNDCFKEKLISKGFNVIGEFSCPGLNTNVFLKYLGGLNKKRPNENDLGNSKNFAQNLSESK